MHLLPYTHHPSSRPLLYIFICWWFCAPSQFSANARFPSLAAKGGWRYRHSATALGISQWDWLRLPRCRVVDHERCLVVLRYSLGTPCTTCCCLPMRSIELQCSIDRVEANDRNGWFNKRVNYKGILTWSFVSPSARGSWVKFCPGGQTNSWWILLWILYFYIFGRGIFAGQGEEQNRRRRTLNLTDCLIGCATAAADRNPRCVRMIK